jgi:hypothetical protein
MSQCCINSPDSCFDWQAKPKRHNKSLDFSSFPAAVNIMRRVDGKIPRGSLQISSMNTAWLQLYGAVTVKVLDVSKAETVSVMTDFLAFISEFIGLCC